MKMQDDDLLPDERALLEGNTTAEAPAEDAAAEAAPVDETAKADEPGTSAAATTSEATEQPAAEEAGESEELDPQALAAVAGETNERAPATYEVQAKDFAAERAALDTQEADVNKRWSDGELSDPEQAAELRKLRDQRDALLREEVRAETIADINRQNTRREQSATLANIRAASASAGEVDYSDDKNAAAFDNMLRAVINDPANENISFGEAAAKAHDALCAVRGIKRAAPAPAHASTPAPAPATAAQANTTAQAAAAPAAPAAEKTDQRKAIPPTLTGLPVAASAPIGNDFLTSLAAIDDPDAAEAALAAMPKQQREAIMRSTINTSARR